MKQKSESNNIIYIIILLAFAALTIGTFTHDPLLHGIVAKIYGWEIEDYETGLMIGSTSAITGFSESQSPSIFSYWLFYMFPSIFIFIGTIIITLLNPNRFVLTTGIILTFLNLSSLNPSITGSDSNNAVQMLITKGWIESQAYALHYLLWFVFWILWVLYIYVAIENNSRDARSRIRNIFH